MKEYLHKKNIHQQYRTRYGLQRFAGNYLNDKQFARSSWLCICQMAQEDEGHLTSGQCTIYVNLTDKFSDLTNIESLIQFFNDVLERRDILDNQDTHNPVGGVITSVYANPVLPDRISQSRD